MQTNTRIFAHWRTALGLILCTAAVLIGLNTSGSRAADAAPTAIPGFEGIDVVQLDGLIDPPNASLLLSAIDRAERRGSTMLVLQIDSEGAVGTDPVKLARAVRTAKVPVVAWVGPAGAQARGGAALIADAASKLSLASNATIGPLFPTRLDRGSSSSEPLNEVVAPERRAAANSIAYRSIGATEAKKRVVIDSIEPVLVNLVIDLDGVSIATANGTRRLGTAEVEKVGNSLRHKPNQPVRFRKLSINGQVQHTLGTPWAAYFLFAIGACLVVLEFFTISIGIAGVVGALSLVFATFGFSHLPVRSWAIGLLLLGFLGFSIDIQAGGLGPWTVIGTASLVGGSLSLYGGSSDLDPAWWIILLVVLGVVTFMLGAMTAMLRSRFSTPTVGRQGMIGEMGTAEADVNPEGMVRVRGTLWKARTNRSTPLARGAVIRVVAVDGMVLEVEPEVGGARDHRDRSPKPQPSNT